LRGEKKKSERKKGGGGEVGKVNTGTKGSEKRGIYTYWKRIQRTNERHPSLGKKHKMVGKKGEDPYKGIKVTEKVEETVQEKTLKGYFTFRGLKDLGEVEQRRRKAMWVPEKGGGK